MCTAHAAMYSVHTADSGFLSPEYAAVLVCSGISHLAFFVLVQPSKADAHRLPNIRSPKLVAHRSRQNEARLPQQHKILHCHMHCS